MASYRKHGEALSNAMKEMIAEREAIAQDVKRLEGEREKAENAARLAKRDERAKAERAAAVAGYDLAEAKERLAAFDKEAERRASRAVREARGALADDMARETVANPDEVDERAAYLLGSGLMTAADYEGMGRRFEGNPTMRRAVKASIEGKIASLDGDERAEYVRAAASIPDPEGDARAAMDALCECAARLGRNPALGKSWDALAGDALGVF